MKWTFDVNSSDKFVLLDLSSKKESDIEYNVSKYNNGIAETKINYDKDINKIFYTQFTSIKIKNNIDELYYYVQEKYDSQSKFYSIQVYFAPNIKSRKSMMKLNILDHRYWNIITDPNKYNEHVDKIVLLVNSITENNYGEFIDFVGNKHIIKNFIFKSN